MAGKFDGKSVIVTGASRGLGKGIAKVFAEQGASVLIVARNETAGSHTVEEIETAGGVASFCRADVSRWSDVETMVQATMERYGAVHVLCANAGIFPSSPIEDLSEEEWDEVQAVNVKGMFLAVKACLPHMKKQNYGRIVLTSSITGPITGYPGWAHYGASKAAMLGFMRTAAIECAKHNITINAVLPGNIITEGMETLGQEHIRGMEQSIPMGRLGDPEDIGYAALFFASPEAKYITGQTLIVDGGQTLPESEEGLI
ncbi:MAG: 3-oxoacyl-ACP reductase FabG [Gammaproteobacteria bacterium]